MQYAGAQTACKRSYRRAFVAWSYRQLVWFHWRWLNNLFKYVRLIMIKLMHFQEVEAETSMAIVTWDVSMILMT